MRQLFTSENAGFCKVIIVYLDTTNILVVFSKIRETNLPSPLALRSIELPLYFKSRGQSGSRATLLVTKKNDIQFKYNKKVTQKTIIIYTLMQKCQLKPYLSYCASIKRTHH